MTFNLHTKRIRRRIELAGRIIAATLSDRQAAVDVANLSEEEFKAVFNRVIRLYKQEVIRNACKEFSTIRKGAA